VPALPSSLALTTIAPGAQILSADHRTNYSAIQTAVNALIALFSNGSIDGDPMVWDATNTKWVAASTLAAGRPRAPRMVTSTLAGGPPASPVDQDIWVATTVDALGTRWVFQYNAGSGSAFKWEFIGGGYTAADVAASESTASATPVELATVQRITLARAGDYSVHYGSDASTSIAGAVQCGVTVNGVLVTDSAVAINAGVNIILQREDPIAGVAAAASIKAVFSVPSGGGTGSWLRRFMHITPRRIS
jgi:hypothetical protein